MKAMLEKLLCQPEHIGLVVNNTIIHKDKVMTNMTIEELANQVGNIPIEILIKLYFASPKTNTESSSFES